MQVVTKTTLEAFVLSFVGCAAGFAGNAIREKGLVLTRDYFEIAMVPTEAGEIPTKEGEPDEGSLADHCLPVVTLDDVCAYFCAVDYVPGSSDTRYLFIDARNDACYSDGHIPGAIQLDHYYKDKHLPAILPVVESIESVIIYCNGGDCEDGILVSMDLLAEGVPADKVLLFRDGWEAWVQAELPVETEEH